MAAAAWLPDPLWIIPPVDGAPVVFTLEQARALHDQLGGDNRRSRRQALNQAIKYVRKASTKADGSPVVVEIDITAKQEYLIPKFVYPGIGQYGVWEFQNLIVFNWRAVIAQMSEDDFERLFALAGPERQGIKKVAFVVIGKQGRWFAGAGAADYELSVWTDAVVVVMRSGYTGDLNTKFHNRGELLETSGPTALHQVRGQKKWHSPFPTDPTFLYGGVEDDECMLCGAIMFTARHSEPCFSSPFGNLFFSVCKTAASVTRWCLASADLWRFIVYI